MTTKLSSPWSCAARARADNATSFGSEPSPGTTVPVAARASSRIRARCADEYMTLSGVRLRASGNRKNTVPGLRISLTSELRSTHSVSNPATDNDVATSTAPSDAPGSCSPTARSHRSSVSIREVDWAALEAGHASARAAARTMRRIAVSLLL